MATATKTKPATKAAAKTAAPKVAPSPSIQAVIQAGQKQYVVRIGQTLEIDLMANSKVAKPLEFAPLMIIDGAKTLVGRPTLKERLVKAEVVGEVKGDKLQVLHFKAKKRVKKLTGHRQHYTQIKIISIG